MSSGPTGVYGPNDGAYACSEGRRAAVLIKSAWSFYVWGYDPWPRHFPPSDHPLYRAMEALAEFDKEVAEYMNTTHDPDLFTLKQPDPNDRPPDMPK